MPHCYEFPRPAVAVDVVIYSRLPVPSLLLIQRLHDPFADCWALSGGFLEMNETLEQAAEREVLEETGIIVCQLIPLASFSAVNRDPRGRVISFAYLARFESRPDGQASDDAKSMRWFPLDSLPELAFDHSEIIQLALANLVDPEL